VQPVTGRLGEELPHLGLAPGFAFPLRVLGRGDEPCHVADELAFKDRHL
jgi:hypothetical protein